ncbi:MAG: DNA-binding protein [Candidatus Thorarchaeota archaeon]
MSDEDYELAMLRRKKMAKLMAQEKKQQESKDQEARVDVERTKLIQRFLASDAHSYLDNLKTREPAIGKQVEDIILYLIVYRGLRQTIKQLDIRYIERQVKGEEPTIRVQRDGETSDFGSYVRDAIKKSKSDDISD